MREPRVVVLIAAIAAASTSLIAGPLSKDWKRLDAAHFTAVGNASPADFQRTVARLEAFRDALRSIVPGLAPRGNTSPLLVLFSDFGSFEPFQPRDARGKRQEWVGGYFTAVPSGEMFVLPANGDDMTTAIHEYVHYLMHRNIPGAPPWVQEGMPDFYSTFDLEKNGSVVIGRVPPWRALSLRRSTYLPLEDVVAPDALAHLGSRPERVDMFYAQSWALVHYLTIGENGKRQEAFASYLNAVAKGQPSDAAFTAAFGMSVRQMDSALRAYLNQVAITALRFKPVSKPAAQEQPARPSPMSVAEAEALQAKLLVHAGGVDEAERHAERSIQADDHDVRANVSLAMTRAAQGKTADALTAASSAAAAAPQDFEAQYVLASVLRQADRVDDAVAAASKAADLNPTSVHAWYQLSMAALAAGRDAQANAAFAQVRRYDDDPEWRRRRAYEALALGRAEIAAADAKAYVDQHGLGDDTGVYTCFVAAIALRRAGRGTDADSLLAAAAATLKPDTWTATVATFLQGQMSPDALLRRASNNGERTEAHTYVGIAELDAGKTDSAIRHFEWVSEQGSRNYTEYGIALGELRRLRASQRPAP